MQTLRKLAVCCLALVCLVAACVAFMMGLTMIVTERPSVGDTIPIRYASRRLEQSPVKNLEPVEGHRGKQFGYGSHCKFEPRGTVTVIAYNYWWLPSSTVLVRYSHTDLPGWEHVCPSGVLFLWDADDFGKLKKDYLADKRAPEEKARRVQEEKELIESMLRRSK